MSATMAEYAAVEFPATEIPVPQGEWRNSLSDRVSAIRTAVLTSAAIIVRDRAQMIEAVTKEPEAFDQLLDDLKNAKATAATPLELIETAETRIMIAMAAVIEPHSH
jgi:hypothetical protein